MESSKKPWGIIGGVVVIIAAIVGYMGFGKTTDTTTTPVTATSTDTTDTTVAGTSTTSGQTSKYKNGTYSAEGSYISPDGPQKVGVKLTITNDIVTDAVFTPEPQGRESAEFQNKFAAGYKQVVIGKSLNTLNVGRVSGSSLTPNGFNDAVAKIKVQAQA